MSGIGNEIVIILLLIVASGFFAMAEMALITARKSQLQDWNKKGHRRAKVALELALAPKQLLAAVQACMTLLSILIGVFAGKSIADWITASIGSIPLLAAYQKELGLALAVLLVTYVALVIGAMAPKRVAMRRPEEIAVLLATTLQLFTKTFAPVVRLLTVSTDAVCWFFGKSSLNESPARITEEEVKMLVRQGTEAGVFEESEQDMVEAVLRLGDKPARSLMTPRTRITWLDLESTHEQIREKILSSGHSCFPVVTGNLDTVDGVVHAKDLLAHNLAGNFLDLRLLIQQPLFVPRTMSALEMLDAFKKSGQHIALVVDEYGGIEGLLTHHDILEAIAGDISFGDRFGSAKAMQRQDGSWLLDGMLSVDEFKEIFHVESLPGEKRDAYQTLGGFVFTQMGRIPSVADYFEWNGLRLEVVDMDGKRIDKVLVASLCGESERPTAPLAPYRDETEAK